MLISFILIYSIYEYAKLQRVSLPTYAHVQVKPSIHWNMYEEYSIKISNLFQYGKKSNITFLAYQLQLRIHIIQTFGWSCTPDELDCYRVSVAVSQWKIRKAQRFTRGKEGRGESGGTSLEAERGCPNYKTVHWNLFPALINEINETHKITSSYLQITLVPL